MQRGRVKDGDHVPHMLPQMLHQVSDRWPLYISGVQPLGSSDDVIIEALQPLRFRLFNVSILFLNTQFYDILIKLRNNSQLFRSLT